MCFYNYIVNKLFCVELNNNAITGTYFFSAWLLQQEINLTCFWFWLKTLINNYSHFNYCNIYTCIPLPFSHIAYTQLLWFHLYNSALANIINNLILHQVTVVFMTNLWRWRGVGYFIFNYTKVDRIKQECNIIAMVARPPA